MVEAVLLRFTRTLTVNGFNRKLEYPVLGIVLLYGRKNDDR